MIEIHKISRKYDAAVIPRVSRKISYVTKSNDLNHVVLCDNKFKSHFGKFWQYQDIVYDYKAEIHGTGSQSLHR